MNCFWYVKQASNSSSFQSAKKLLYFHNKFGFVDIVLEHTLPGLRNMCRKNPVLFFLLFSFFNIILKDKLGQLKKEKKRQVKRGVILINSF